MSKDAGSATLKRLQSELMALMTTPAGDGLSAFPSGDSLLVWSATIAGPPESPYMGCTYKLRLTFGSDYPFSPPTVVFTTPIWHPNVSTTGDICLDLLKDAWSSALSVGSVLLSIQGMLRDANPASPLNPIAADQWADPVLFRKSVGRGGGRGGV